MEMLKINSDKFEEEVLKSKTPVLVDFNADWCGPCKMLGPIIEEEAKENDKVKFVSVNIDDNEELAEQYNVFTIPCLVLFKDGKEEKRNVGFIQKDVLEEFIGE